MSASRQIPLHRADGSICNWTVVSDEDFESLAAHVWCRNSNGYAVRNGERGKKILMHRQVLDLRHGDERETDHINRDRLDNRRTNLRIVTHAENMRNVPSHHGSTSRHRAVHWDRDKARWRARPRIDGVYHHLGYFGDEDQAGEAVRQFFASRGVTVTLAGR